MMPVLPVPLELPWPFKPVESAEWGIESDPHGWTRCWIRHDVLRGVTPAMLHWWFQHLEGDVEVDGRRIDRYRAWHPRDHVRVRYQPRLTDGSVGPGAAIHITEYLGRKRRYKVDVISEIVRLDEAGFAHCPTRHGIRLARAEYSFVGVPGGTLYENSLTISPEWSFAKRLRPLLRPVLFSSAHGRAWIKHNIEEVGMLENFLPQLAHGR